MSDKNQTPLDYEEVVTPKDVTTLTPMQKRLQTLEFFPLLILAIGMWMTNTGKDNADTFLNIGGLSSAFLYLFFSWYMFRVGKYRPLELVLSILCGLVFPIGIFGALFEQVSWPYGRELLQFGTYGGVLLLFVSIVLFAFHLKDKRASLFYRNIIARLLIFTVLLVYFGRIYF